MKEPGATDFYVYVRLNRGRKYTKRKPAPPSAPEYYVIPTEIAEGLPKTGWGQARLHELPDRGDYRDRWDIVKDFLGMEH